MVKATAEARLEITGGQDGSFIASIAAKCKQEVSVDVTKKLKTLSFRRFFLPAKGRRKDKDAPLNPQDDTKRYLEEDFSSEKVLDADWERLVSIPHDIDRNEWLATHTISFFEHMNMLYGTVSGFCTSTGCSTMSAPHNVQYQWVDEKGKKCKCAAPQYIEFVMTYTKKTILDHTVFPTKYGDVFPQSFESTIKKIHKLLFHVMAHLYQAHYKEIVLLGLHPHLNTLFEHLMSFSHQFSLVEEKETEILDDLYKKLRSGASLQKGSSGTTPDLPPPVPVNMERDLVETKCNSGSDSLVMDRLVGTDTNSPALRPTSLPCATDKGHMVHHSANGSPRNYNHDNRHTEENKENVICDRNLGNQSQQPALSPMTTPMTT